MRYRQIFACAVFCVATMCAFGVPVQDKAELPKAVGIRTMCFAPDGIHLAVAVGEPKKSGRVVVWDTNKDKLAWMCEEPLGAAGIEYSPDGKSLAVGLYDHSAKLLSAGNGKVQKTLPGHPDVIARVAFSPDGKLLATSGLDKTVKLWNTATGELMQTLPFPRNYAVSLNFSPSGRWLLGCGGPLRVWEVTTGREQVAMGDNRDLWYFESAVFADDNSFLAGDEHGFVRLWTVTGEQGLRFRMNDPFRIAYSRVARTLAVSSRTFNADQPVHLFAFSPQSISSEVKKHLDALLVKLDDNDYHIREATGREVLKLGTAIEPELRRLMKDSPSVELRIRCRRLRDELLNKPRATLDCGKITVDAFAFSPDGRRLATGSRDGVVRIWDLAKNTETSRFVPAELKE